ncbi:MAG: PEP-CTERM sorting domain-containing protein [Phycisphaerales bacterium]|nr:PEP-CTERM sorting domain-containing protein [Phycisphaerales bacterium]
MALAGGLRADVYSQDFNVADGTTVLGDGSDIRSNNAGMGQVAGGQLQMTDDLLTGTRTVYRIPALADSSQGFTATFNFDLSDSAGGMEPADGFSFVYGDIPAWDGTGGINKSGYGEAEEGMGADNEISFQADTWRVGDAEHGFNLGLRLGGGPQPDPFFQNTDVLGAGQSIIGGTMTLSWNPTSGASMVIERGAGLETIFTNVAVPGFTGSDAYSFAFTARTGGATETLNLDNVNITTVPEPATMSLLALGGLAMLRRRRL